MNLSEGHKEYMKAIEALNEKGKAIRDNVNNPKHYEVLPGVEVMTLERQFYLNTLIYIHV